MARLKYEKTAPKTAKEIAAEKEKVELERRRMEMMAAAAAGNGS